MTWRRVGAPRRKRSWTRASSGVSSSSAARRRRRSTPARSAWRGAGARRGRGGAALAPLAPLVGRRLRDRVAVQERLDERLAPGLVEGEQLGALLVGEQQARAVLEEGALGLGPEERLGVRGKGGEGEAGQAGEDQEKRCDGGWTQLHADLPWGCKPRLKRRSKRSPAGASRGGLRSPPRHPRLHRPLALDLHLDLARSGGPGRRLRGVGERG